MTGASSGIGAATARALAAEGVHLVLCARRGDRLQALAGELHGRHAGLRVHTATVDVRDAAAVEAFVGAIPVDFKPIDILVNNAVRAGKEGGERGGARANKALPSRRESRTPPRTPLSSAGPRPGHGRRARGCRGRRGDHGRHQLRRARAHDAPRRAGHGGPGLRARRQHELGW